MVLMMRTTNLHVFRLCCRTFQKKFTDTLHSVYSSGGKMSGDFYLVTVSAFTVDYGTGASSGEDSAADPEIRPNWDSCSSSTTSDMTLYFVVVQTFFTR